ncbi:MAG: hypothetical protein F8N15_10060 [Methanobacterium sp.]|nr:hypothetical protein [Methanobacterium sp.]
MNPKKSGTVFIVLMIALLAFGVASTANVVGLGSNLIDSVVPSNLSLNGQQQVSAIGDTSFTPVYVNKRVVVNITNTTPVVPTNNTTNNTQTNSG